MDILTTLRGPPPCLLFLLLLILPAMAGAATPEPGRIYASGRQLLNGGLPQYMHGVNTPWHYWNEFGATGGNRYDHDWWEAEFQRLRDRGINATRIWVNCSSDNQGIRLNSDGTCQPPTAQFWTDLDDLMALARRYEIYVMPTVMSFDHFDINHANQATYYQMLGSQAGVQSFADEFIVPLAERYQDNYYLWAIDLCNEPEWLTERADLATPRGGTCTPVGGGSDLYDVDFRLPDHVVGMQLTVDGVSRGLVLERVGDSRLRAAAYSGTSSAKSYGGGSGGWFFNNWSWAALQRYVAVSTAALHHSASSVLVCYGAGTIKYASASYEADYFSDAILTAITGDGASALDLHQIHWYAWAEPWFRLQTSPVEHGLSAKPAVMGELPMHWAALNIPSVGASNIPSGDTWEPGTFYRTYEMVIADTGSGTGKTYMALSTGTSGSGGGPSGTGSSIADGSLSWEYVRDAITGAEQAWDWFAANGWYGHFPWTSNGIDFNRGLYNSDGSWTEMGLDAASFASSWDAFINPDIWPDIPRRITIACLAGGLPLAVMATVDGDPGSRSDVPATFSDLANHQQHTIGLEEVSADD